ncbi:MAG: lipid-A-disaccharide synthase [Gemmatimonadales bacterium]
MTRGPRIFLSAGEPSGDLHAGAVARALLARYPDATIDAFGGPQLAASGARILYPMERYTVMGFAEIVSKIPAHAGLYFDLKRKLEAGHYDLFCCVDYPGFHMRMAGAAKRAGVKVLYYVAPQLWAWRPERAERLRRSVDRLAVIFPFEAPFFEKLGIPADYVGHPLLDRQPWPTRSEARATLGISAGARVLAVFPGSRRQEVRRLWEPFRDAASQLLEDGSADRALVAAVADQDYPDLGRLEPVEADSLTVLAAADAVLAKSGTTTLEAAISDVPMVVAYRVHRLTEILARRLIRVQWVTPVNLIADEAVVDELLQDEVTAANLASRARPLLDPSHPTTIAQRRALAQVRERLGRSGAADRVAMIAAELLG